MRIAYIISAYRLPDQLTRLVRRLQNPDASFFIHVDKKTPSSVYRRMIEGVGRLPNVHFLSRHRCTWGGIGHTWASLKGIDVLIRQNIPFDYAILLTGQDYPLFGNNRIQEFFELNDGYSFIEYESPSPDPGWNVCERLGYWSFFFGKKHCIFPLVLKTGRYVTMKKAINALLPDQRAFFPDLEPFGGSSYWNLTREAVEHIFDFVQQRPEFFRYFKTVYCADEIFFQTILLNSSLRPKVINDSLRHIVWPLGGSPHPKVFTSNDFEELATSSALFARKFDTRQDGRILDLIDGHLSSEQERAGSSSSL